MDFDLAQGEIGGRIKFSSGSSGLAELPEWQRVQQQVDVVQNIAEQASDAA